MCVSPCCCCACMLSAPRRTRRTCLACRAACDPPPRRALQRRGRVSGGALRVPLRRRGQLQRNCRATHPESRRCAGSARSCPARCVRPAPQRRASACRKQTAAQTGNNAAGLCVSARLAKACRLRGAAHRIARCGAWWRASRRAALERAFQRRRNGRRQESSLCHQIHHRRCAAAVAQPRRAAACVGGACRRVRRSAACRVCGCHARIRRLARAFGRQWRRERGLRRLPVHGSTRFKA